MGTTATRTIAPGEEITLQYIPVVAMPLLQRRKKLTQCWGFVCACVRCTAEESLSHADARWFRSGCRDFREWDDSGSSGGSSCDSGGSSPCSDSGLSHGS